MLVSTDPASNLQDVFNMELNNKGVVIDAVPNLTVANFEPEKAAAEYRESVLDPYRVKLPEVVLKNMEKQLSGFESKKQVYKNAVNTLADKKKTTLILVARPEV